MRELNTAETNEVNGAGWFLYVFPVVLGFIAGGPAGAVAMAGGIIATQGAKNLEHLHKHGEIPTFDQIVN